MNENGVRRRWLYLLLVIPFVALLWMPIYSREKPVLFDFPFFYWWQFLWVIITALLLAVVHVGTRPRGGYRGVVRGEDERP